MIFIGNVMTDGLRVVARKALEYVVEHDEAAIYIAASGRVAAVAHYESGYHEDMDRRAANLVGRFRCTAKNVYVRDMAKVVAADLKHVYMELNNAGLEPSVPTVRQPTGERRGAHARAGSAAKEAAKVPKARHLEQRKRDGGSFSGPRGERVLEVPERAHQGSASHDSPVVIGVAA
jgi:hypothetical protein